MKKILVIILLVCLASVLVWSNIDNHAIYSAHVMEPLPELFVRAKRMLAAGHADSAMAIGNLIVARETEGERSADDARAVSSAYHLLGNLYAAQSDYPRALEMYHAGADVAEEANLPRNRERCLFNVANVLIEIGDYRNGLQGYVERLPAMLRVGDWNNALLVYSNIMEIAVLKSIDNLFTSTLLMPDTLRLPSGVPLAPYARALSSAYGSYKVGDTHGAVTDLAHAASSIPSSQPDSLRLALTAHLISAKMLGDGGDVNGAISAALGLHEIASQAGIADYVISIDDLLWDLFRRSGRTEEGRRYRMESLELADSLKNVNIGMRIQNLRSAREMRTLNNRIQGMEEHRRNLTFLTLMITLVLVVTGCFLVVLRRKNRDLAQKNSVLYQQNRMLLDVDHPVATSTPATPDASAPITRYETSSLTDSRKKEIAAKIKEFFVTNAEIYSPDFCLPRLAEAIGEKSHAVSQVINEVMDKNFNVLLADYRIREACRRIADPSYSHLTIQGIAEGLGFRSRSGFSKVFRRVTGMTPSEYQRQSQL